MYGHQDLHKLITKSEDTLDVYRKDKGANTLEDEANTTLTEEDTLKREQEKKKSEEFNIRQLFDIRRYIIEQDNTYKTIFDTSILFVIAYSCFTTVYYVSFNQNPNSTLYVVDIVVNVAFLLDFIFNFLTEYKDKETLEWVKDPYKIALEYAKGFMLLDFVATFPFDIFSENGSVMWTRLIRLARLSKLASLLDIGRITRIVKRIFKESTSKDRI